MADFYQEEQKRDKPSTKQKEKGLHVSSLRAAARAPGKPASEPGTSLLCTQGVCTRAVGIGLGLANRFRSICQCRRMRTNMGGR